MKNRAKNVIIAQQILKIMWGLLSACLLALVLYSTIKQDQVENRQRLTTTADAIADHIDSLISDLIESIHTMRLNGYDFKNCQQKLLPDLRKMLFNNPQLSGIVISDHKREIICSTLVENSIPVIQTLQPLTMYGPVQLTNTEKPTFIIQQRLGEYYVDLYILEQVIERTLRIPAPIAQSVALYDGNQNKIILQIEHENLTNSWQLSLPNTYFNIASISSNTDPLLAKADLTNLKKFQIIIIANPNSLSHFSLLHAILIALLLLSLSFSIYYYLHRLIHHHFSLSRTMRQALKNNQFFPMYQPIFDINTNKYCGAEVLIRWRTSTKEIITPDFFIAEAEQSELIVPITLQLIHKTFEECQNLLLSKSDFHLAFNLSAMLFTNNHFFESFLTLIKKYRIPPQQLTLELTERDLLIHDNNLLLKKMNDLRLAGFSLAVDDFGTGYASIGYLQHFPFNYLKIDQLFIRAIGTGAITETLNQSIINMAKDLNLHIIAEGVETYVQLAFLQTHGVHLLQGWYFALPMPIERLIPFLEKSSK